MKKIIKHIIVLCMALMIMALHISVAFAESIYYADGYQYTFINNDKISLYGADDGILDPLTIPSAINNRAVVDIRNMAFFENTVLSSVDFSYATNIERIGSFAFANCSNLDGEVMIPDTVTQIESAAFQNCTSLDSVVFNASTTFVPNQCFNGCTALSSVTLNDAITKIGDYAFANCPNLTYIEIPASVTDIASTSFQNDADIQFGVYNNSYAAEFAESNGISYVILDPPAPTEPPTEPVTEAPTEPITPTQAPTQEPTQQPTEAVGYYLGDVDNNGVVDVFDVTFIQRHLAHMIIKTECDFSHADVNGDDLITVDDTTFISRFLCHMSVKYPIGEFVQA